MNRKAFGASFLYWVDFKLEVFEKSKSVFTLTKIKWPSNPKATATVCHPFCNRKLLKKERRLQEKQSKNIIVKNKQTKQETMMHKLLYVSLLALVAGLVQAQNQIDFGVEDRHSDPKSIIPFGKSAFSE